MADEEKIVSIATLEDEFKDNKLIVVLKSEFSNFDSIDSNIKEKLFNCGAVEIENLSEFSKQYVTVNGELDANTAYELSEYYSENHFKQALSVTLNKSDKQNVLEVMREVEKMREIFYVSPDMLNTIQYVPCDSMYSEQWSLNGTYGINVQGAWDITRGASSVRVGVIDTGIASHTDLNSNVTTGKDFDENTTDSSNTSDDLKGHGTSVAGIIGAVSNTRGICGVSPNVTIVPLQISNDSSGTSSESYEIAAIQYAINLWGYRESNLYFKP